MSDNDSSDPKKPFPNNPGPQFPHACMGLNACKGLGRTQDNECAGKGYCATTPDHTCHVLNQCKDQGGCGLYGTAEEFSRPADNGCKFQGSCATPINAERFSTTAPTKWERERPDDPIEDNRGKSVWHRARERFEKRWPNMDKYSGYKYGPPEGSAGKKPEDSPEHLGKWPEEFPDGPTTKWLKHYNPVTHQSDCSDFTACGSSGMSGGGSCA